MNAATQHAPPPVSTKALHRPMPPRPGGPVAPARKAREGDTVSLADQTRAALAAAEQPPATPGTHNAASLVDVSALTPRELWLRFEYTDPTTLAVEQHQYLSRVMERDDWAKAERLVVGLAGVPLDMLDKEGRHYFRTLARALTQIRECEDRVRELLWEPEVLFQIVEVLIKHHARFQLRGIAPSDAAKAQPSVVVHDPWSAHVASDE